MTNPGRSVDPQAVAASAATVTGLLAASELRAGDVVAGRYRVERLLGMGGMGVVYLAHDQQLGIEVALKLLRPELASRPDAFERFRQELLLARQVSNPHVVRIHDLVRHGEAWLISMDYVAGQSLEQLLDERGTLSPEEALRITRQVASGLGAAHLRGVIHRDLKPANILIDQAGDAYITDFGVARSAGSTGITGSGVVIGTPEYLSPEQARAEVGGWPQRPLRGRPDALRDAQRHPALPWRHAGGDAGAAHRRQPAGHRPRARRPPALRGAAGVVPAGTAPGAALPVGRGTGARDRRTPRARSRAAHPAPAGRAGRGAGARGQPATPSNAGAPRNRRRRRRSRPGWISR